MLQRVHLDIQVGEHANNYAEIAAKDKLTELQLRVRQLVEQVDQIQKEQNYQRVSLCGFKQSAVQVQRSSSCEEGDFCCGSLVVSVILRLLFLFSFNNLVCLYKSVAVLFV